MVCAPQPPIAAMLARALAIHTGKVPTSAATGQGAARLSNPVPRGYSIRHIAINCLAARCFSSRRSSECSQYKGLLTFSVQSRRAIATFLATWRYCPQHGRMSGILPSIRKVATVRLYTAVPFPMEPGMQSETLKKARAATFLNRSALCLLMFPVACLIWALNAYPHRTHAGFASRWQSTPGHSPGFSS